MTRPRITLPSLLALSTLTALGCAEAIKYSGQAERAAVDSLLPVAEENKLGNELARELEKEVTILQNDAVQSYVRALGTKVARAVKDKPRGITFRFAVVDDDKTVNAFAMPGGRIYVYTGLLKKAADEAELVSVLAHEIAHVTQRHVAQNLIAANGIEAVTGIALGEKPDLLAQLVAGIATNGFLLKYSRDHEREADRVGIGYAVGAGFDPQGFVRFFQKLADGTPELLAIISSHPATAERIRTAREIIAGLGSVPSETGAEAYRAMLAQLI